MSDLRGAGDDFRPLFALGEPPLRCRSCAFRPLRPRGICRTDGKIAAVCVEIQFTDFRAYDSTPLSLDADMLIKTR